MNCELIELQAAQMSLPSVPASVPLFYSQSADAFIVFFPDRIQIISEKKNISIPRINATVLRAALSKDLNSVAFLKEKHLFVFLDIQKGTQCLYNNKQDTEHNILFFQFVYGIGLCQLIMLDNSALRFFGLTPKFHDFKYYVPLKVSGFWYEPVGQILLVRQSFDREGLVLQPFFFSEQKKDLKETKGVKVCLTENEKPKGRHSQGMIDFLVKRIGLSSSNRQKGIELQSTALGTELFKERKYNSNYQLFLTNLYGVSFLLLLNQDDGKISLFSFKNQKFIVQKNQIRIPADSDVQVNVIDNLLVLHLCTQGLTILYDVERPHSQPLFTPQALTVSLVSPPLQIFSIRESIYKSVFMDRWVAHPGPILMRYNLKFQFLANIKSTQLDVFHIIYRRNCTKQILFSWLVKESASERIMPFVSIWKTILDSFLKRPDSPTTVTPQELYDNFFVKVRSTESCSKQFQKRIMVELIRQALQRNVHLPIQFLIMLVNLLFELKAYPEFNFLVQYKVIKSSLHIADMIYLHSLKVEDPTRQRLIQIALGMYLRAKNYQALGERLLEQGMYTQSYQVLKRYKQTEISEEMQREFGRALPQIQEQIKIIKRAKERQAEMLL